MTNLNPAYTFSPLTTGDVPEAAYLYAGMAQRVENDPQVDEVVKSRTEIYTKELTDPRERRLIKQTLYKLADPQNAICGVISYTPSAEDCSADIDIFEISTDDNLEHQDQLIQHFIAHGKEIGMKELAYFFSERTHDKEFSDKEEALSQFSENILRRNGFVDHNRKKSLRYCY